MRWAIVNIWMNRFNNIQSASPVGISGGYWLDGFVTSKRQPMKTRRILLKHSRDTYQIHPDTVIPDMIGRTEDVEKGLYLRRYGVPYEAIAHVLGMNAITGTTRLRHWAEFRLSVVR